MKTRYIILFCILMSLGDVISAQNLRTIKTYHDLWGVKVHEVYTVIGTGGQKHGTYKAYDEDGFIYAMYTYSKGVKNGPWKHYGFTNGGPGSNEKVREEGNFLNNIEHGRFTAYNFVNGKHLLWYEKLYDNGKEMEETWYYENGNKSSYTCRDGISYQWYEDKTIKIECGTKNNQMDGEHKEYYPNGNLHKLYNFKAGSKDGKSEIYYENGKIEISQNFVLDQLTELTKYNNDGTMSMRETLDRGRTTNYITYFSNGNKQSESTLSNNGKYLTVRYDSLSSMKTAELIQDQRQVATSSDEGLSGKRYYANGKIKEEWVKGNDRNGKPSNETKYYKEDGILDYAIDMEGVKINYYPNKVVASKTWPLDARGNQRYVKFNEEGENIENGDLNRKNELVFQEKFTKGRRTYQYKDGRECWYYPNGTIHKECNLWNDSIVFEYNENKQVISRSTRDGKYWVYNYPGAIATVQFKGEKDKDGNFTGKWYIYNEKGVLKNIEENGITRKPTKDEKLNHASYLQYLVDAMKP